MSTNAAGTNASQPTSSQGAAHLNKMAERLAELWKNQMVEMQQLDAGSKQDFKHHNDLPLARIKRIMKSDEDVRMISAEAPILFAKACELFILELTARAWCYSEHNKRNGLERDDIHSVLKNTDIFDFLAEVVIHQNDGTRALASQSQQPNPPLQSVGVTSGSNSTTAKLPVVSTTQFNTQR